MTKKSLIMINGKTYTVWVEKGIRYIDGMTVEKFLDQADPLTMVALAMKGKQILGAK